MKVTPVCRTTVTDQVLEQLGILIRTGELKPGDKLPNERECAEMFATTRARIREALRALALIGLIETRPGDGSYVTELHDISNDTMELMFYKERKMFGELYEARRVIEPPIIYKAAEHISDLEILQLDGIIESYGQPLSTDKDVVRFLQLIDKYDKVLAAAKRNSVLIKLMDVFIGMKAEANRKMNRIPNAMENSLTQLRQMLDALKTRDVRKVATCND